MSTKLRHLASLLFLLPAACGENDPNVRTIDAGADAPGVGGPASAGGSGGGGGQTGVGQTTSCDPLAPAPKPITWASILAGGRSASGTVYAADQTADGSQRVFVSDALGTMVRQRIAGSGSGPGFWVFTVTDGNGPFVLQLDTSTATPRMGVVQGTLPDRKTFVIGQDGEELTVLPNAAIAALPVRNLPGTTVAEYVATLPDGRIMLVTRPQDDWSYQDFRLFLGPLTALEEHPVTKATRFMDGGTTTILFDLGGVQATAYFPVVFADGGFAAGQATLTVAGAVTPLARATVAPAGAAYLCLGGVAVDAGTDAAGGLTSDARTLSAIDADGDGQTVTPPCTQYGVGTNSCGATCGLYPAPLLSGSDGLCPPCSPVGQNVPCGKVGLFCDYLDGRVGGLGASCTCEASGWSCAL